MTGDIQIKTLCPECGYRHQKDRTAGFFVPLGFNDGRYDPTNGGMDPNEVESTGDIFDGINYDSSEIIRGASDKDKRSSAAATEADVQTDEERLHRRMTLEEGRADLRLRLELGPQAQRLNTPSFIRSIGYVRCNCITGVPNDELGWLPVPHPRYVGGIALHPKDICEPNWEGLPPPSAEVLGLVMPFLDGRSVARACCVSPEWRAVGWKLPWYLDLLRLGEIEQFGAHKDVVGAVILGSDGFVFTTGDRRVKVWLRRKLGDQHVCANMGVPSYKNKQYKLMAVPIHDDAIITKALLVQDGRGDDVLWTGSSSGHIRRWSTHRGYSHLSLKSSSPEHRCWINDMILSYSPLETHSDTTQQHPAVVFTGSDDRSILIWDSCTGNLLHRINTRGFCTIQSLACSDRHLFAGTSTGVVQVFSLDCVCERVDPHLCTERFPDEPGRYCLQTELRHGGGTISSLEVSRGCLFTASRDGTVAVFNLAQPGCLHFEKVAVLRGHTFSVTCVALTWSHLYTGSEDGTVRMWELRTGHFNFQRSLDTQEGNRGGVHCLCVDERQQEPAEGGTYSGDYSVGSRCLYIGLNSGEVQQWQLGAWL